MLPYASLLLCILLRCAGALTLQDALAGSPAGEEKAPGSFCNPLDLNYRFQLDAPSRREAADPTMIVFRNRYFLFASKSGGYWHSPDLASWTFVEPTGLPLEDYAPTAMVMNDKVYFTAFNSAAIYESADPVAGNWTKVASIGQYADPALFHDDDGRVYLTSGCHNAMPISIVQLDPADGWKVVAGPSVVAYGDPKQHGWEKFTDWRSMVLSNRPFIEGSWMNKVGGRYVLQYAAPGTEMKGYGDGVFTSDSPFGHYTRDRHSPVSHKPTGFIAGAGHSSTFQDLHGRWWHVTTGVVNVRHNMERRVMLYPAYFNSSLYPSHIGAEGFSTTPSFLVDTVLGDFPVRTDQSRPPWQLLSLNKKTTASSTLHQSLMELNLEEHGTSAWNSPAHSKPRLYEPSQAVDEDVQTWWSAETGQPGEWLAVDLGSIATVHAVQVNLGEQGSRAMSRLREACRYVAEASLDGLSWWKLSDLDRSKASRDAPHEYVELSRPVQLRHLRLTSVQVPANARFSISGLRVFGVVPGVPAPARVDSLQVTRHADDRQKASVHWTAADNAQYYIVRFGLVGGPRFHNYQVYNATSLTIDILSLDERYSFSVDSVGEGGWTLGMTTADA